LLKRKVKGGVLPTGRLFFLGVAGSDLHLSKMTFGEVAPTPIRRNIAEAYKIIFNSREARRMRRL